MNHSDVTPALLNNCIVLDDSIFIKFVISDLESIGFLEKDLIILSPDAGAFKRVFKLCEKIEFKGQIETCSKSRDYVTQLPTQKIPSFDINKPVLIIDDIILGGRTFINITKEIENPCYLAVSHGIFDSGGYGDPMPALESAFNRIYTTNSRKKDTEYTNEKITVFNLPMLK
jgi:ribose-phosphate pyrophosphokinase